MSEILKTNEILSKGYGVSPKLVMIDENLSIEAKAIYAYLSSFCGSGSTAFPQIATIIKHLKISNERFYKHFKLLIKYGYITVTQERNNKGKFANNIYTLNTVIEPVLDDEDIPNSENTDTVITDNEKTDNVISDNVISDNGKPQTNNNNINNNNINNNSINNNLYISKEIYVISDDEVINLWNSLNINNIVSISGTRKKMLNARLKEYKKNNFIKAIENIRQSSFLKGQNQKGWVITFDWFIKPNNFIKVLENNYADKEDNSYLQNKYANEKIKEDHKSKQSVNLNTTWKPKEYTQEELNEMGII